MYEKRTIYLHLLSDVMNLIDNASKVDGDVWMLCGKELRVNAKSINNMFDAVMGGEVIIEYPQNAKQFEDFLMLQKGQQK